MNERIKELMEQASEYAHENRAGDWEVGPAYQDIFHKKFAELIVVECANQVDWILAEGGKTQGDLIKEHFGVEE